MLLGAGSMTALLCLAPQFSKSSHPELPAADRAPSLQPWGNLETTMMVLDRPAEYFEQDLPPQTEIQWHFEGFTSDMLRNFLLQTELDAGLRQTLLDTNRWQVQSDGVLVTPPVETVLSLSRPAREHIYNELAKSPRNKPQRYPFMFRPDGFDEWFAGAELPPEKIALARRLAYFRNGWLCFSDSQAFRLTSSTNEAVALMKVLSRVPAVLARLRVDEKSDIDALVRYWGRGGRERSLRTLLESMARVPGGTSLELTYLLPPVPQQLLYTYPNPALARMNQPLPDCAWSSMNFFNYPPDMIFLDSSNVLSTLERDYRKVPRPSAFGDLIFVYEPGPRPEPVHMCVYIADDIVFTKNGSRLWQPWTLMRLADVMAQYTMDKRLEMAFYRKKGF